VPSPEPPAPKRSYHHQPTTADMAVPGLKRTLVLFGRALRLRCPSCGRGKAMRSWFKVHERCPACDYRLERGEGDYFLGSMMFNLVVSELLFAALLVGIMLTTWPDVPWTFLQYGAPLLMIVAPFALFPLSKTIWMAFDLMLRPESRDETRRPGGGRS
jgi:uncharacterized protein (DUF983 family)